METARFSSMSLKRTNALVKRQMLSITPNVDSTELDDLENRLKVVNQQLVLRKKRAWISIGILWIPIVLASIYGLGFDRWILWIGLSVLYFVVAQIALQLLHAKSQLQAWSNHLKFEIETESARLVAEKDRLLAEAEALKDRRLAEAEALAIEQIRVLKEEINLRRLEMLAIEEEIKYKRKWRWEFDDFPEILEENARLDSQAIRTIEGFAREIDRLREDRYGWRYKYDRKSVPLDTYTQKYRNYDWLRWRLNTMQSWEPPIRASIDVREEEDDIYDELEETNDKESFQEDTIGENLNDEPNREPNSSNQSTQTQQNRRSARTPPNTQASLFDEISLTQRPVTEVPKQRKRLPKYRSIKISDELRNQINEKKIRIGWLGELAVLEFETKRLSTESMIERKEIIHTSLTDDAAGYDIQSWNNDSEIHIEVKTTVGDYWSNLYFTENEFNKMKSLKDSYCLYRICKFNVDTGKGDLFIYEGAEMILETFDFNSKMYMLSEKQN